MTFGLSLIIFAAGCTGIFCGIRFKNKYILIPSLITAAASGILALAAILLIEGIK